MELDAESRALIGGSPLPFENSVTRKRNLGPLHDLLLDACPREPDGISSISKIASILGMTPAAIYKWIKDGKLPGHRARALCQIEGSRKELVDFLPYI